MNFLKLLLLFTINLVQSFHLMKAVSPSVINCVLVPIFVFLVNFFHHLSFGENCLITIRFSVVSFGTAIFLNLLEIILYFSLEFEVWNIRYAQHGTWN